jgi:hypothetical protein
MADGGAVPGILWDVVGLDHFTVAVIGKDGSDTFVCPGYLVVLESGSPAEDTLVFPD